jgi:hypothetical protein
MARRGLFAQRLAAAEYAVALILVPRLDMVAAPKSVEAGSLRGSLERDESLGGEPSVRKHERELILGLTDRLRGWISGRRQSR